MRQNQLENAAFQTEVLQSARQAAHDIRSPLSAMNLVIASLESLCEEKREILKEALSRINKIAEELLALNANEFEAPQNHPKMKSTAVNFAQVVNDAVRFKELEHAKGSVQIYRKIDCTTRARTLGDKDLLTRVLSNLLNNSIEAGSNLINIVLSETSTSLLLTMTDDGNGIPAHILERLLDGSPLSYGKGVKGNGLGLSHARACIQAMKGDFSLTSIQGSGTRIMIRLPKMQRMEKPVAVSV